MIKVCVIGAGINGLSSALRIQEYCPNTAVTLLAETFSPETTSDGAAGVWGPYMLGNTPPEDIYRWSKETHDFLRDIWNSEDCGKMGISMLPFYRVTSAENEIEPPIGWKQIVFGCRALSAEELQTFGKPSLRKGCRFVTFTCESQKLLPCFMEKFKLQGGSVVKRKIENVQSLRKDFDIVVNCAGINAYYIAEDKSLQPKRGQVMRVHAPQIKWGIIDDDDEGNYIIPNQDLIVLGGTHQDDWSRELYKEDSAFIKNGCVSIIPSLKDAPLIREWVGLRPCRPTKGVRLEMEVIQHPGEKPFFLCSNYGHGGSGLTLFWGCSHDTASLVKKAVTQIEMKSKL